MRSAVCIRLVGAFEAAAEVEFEGDEAKEWLQGRERTAPKTEVDFEDSPRGDADHF